MIIAPSSAQRSECRHGIGALDLSPETMKILAIGHSHIDAIKFGYGDMIKREMLPYSMDFSRIDQPSNIESLVEDIASQGDLRLVVSSIAGSAHFTYGSVNNPEAFDFVVPESPDIPLDRDAKLIPYDLIRKKLHSDLADAMAVMKRIKSSIDVPVYQLSPPPPVGDPDAIAAHINEAAARMSEGWVERMQNDMRSRGIAPPALRYKLWATFVDVAKQLCEELGIIFLPPPPEAKDGNGFLREEYRWDGFHANPRYGALIVRQLIALAQRPVVAGEV